MASAKLNRKLRRYGENLFSTYGRSNKLPKTIIGAEHKEIMQVDHSGKVPEPLAPKLRRELVKIAPLGTRGHKYFVGCCCEVRSSNQIILIRSSTPIKDIDFTVARRTRTWQTKRRCQNCRAVFG
ncbi:MAG: hypothetical protein JKY52_16590 [Flavobacteriales bacterium]|nr:hypothetical protein [Flavobacteriales bacterium]